MDADFAGCPDINIDTPALPLGRLFIFPAMERIGRGHDHDIAPAFLQIGGPTRLDGGVLGGPEGIGIGEIAVIAEQVGDGRALVAVEVEQGKAGGDGLPAEQP